MLKKIKEFLNKFNKKENSNKLTGKKKSKLSVAAGFIIVIVLSIIMSEYLGLFNEKLNQSSSSSSKIVYTDINLETEFILEDFGLEGILEKKNENSILYNGLNEVEPLYLDFLDKYNEIGLKSVEDKKFTINNNIYQHSDEKYTYEFDNEEKTIKVYENDELILSYQNKNNIAVVKLDIYELIYENNNFSLECNDVLYRFEIGEELKLIYEKNDEEVYETYDLNSCSLIKIEMSTHEGIYHFFIWDYIKNDLELINNDGVYYIKGSNGEEDIPTFEMNQEFTAFNYYLSDTLEVYKDGKLESVLCFAVLDSYYQENGLPLGLGK